MKRIKAILFLLLLSLTLANFKYTATIAYAAENNIYLGGFPAGFALETRGAYIMGLTDVITEQGIKSPCKEAGIETGDIILSIDGIPVNNAEDVEKAIANGEKKALEVKKCEGTDIIIAQPAKDLSGHYRLGIFIRNGINGIGTVTYIKGDTFASLGHPVTDESGKPLDIVGGQLYPCKITGYIAGERGKPGELRGIFVKNETIGIIEKNLISGVYGHAAETFDKDRLTEIQTGEGKVGTAHIYTTISGESPEKYEISIIKVTDVAGDVKNFVIKINDERLLESTAGIVQGMSGSPIVQDGKLIGAVTHVFVNDPSRGFGISIENMINN